MFHPMRIQTDSDDDSRALDDDSTELDRYIDRYIGQAMVQTRNLTPNMGKTATRKEERRTAKEKRSKP